MPSGKNVSTPETWKPGDSIYVHRIYRIARKQYPKYERRANKMENKLLYVCYNGRIKKKSWNMLCELRKEITMRSEHVLTGAYRNMQGTGDRME